MIIMSSTRHDIEKRDIAIPYCGYIVASLKILAAVVAVQAISKNLLAVNLVWPMVIPVYL